MPAGNRQPTRRQRIAERAIEMHYSPEQVSLLLGMSSRWVRDRIQAGDFGDPAQDGPVLLGGTDWRIPASGLNRYLDAQRAPARLSKPSNVAPFDAAAGF